MPDFSAATRKFFINFGILGEFHLN